MVSVDHVYLLPKLSKTFKDCADPAVIYPWTVPHAHREFLSQWNKFKHAAAPTWSYDLDGHLSLSSTLRVNVEVGIVLDTHAPGLDATTSSVARLGVGCCHSKKQWTMTHEQWDGDVQLVRSELLHLFNENSFYKPEISSTNHIFLKHCVKTTSHIFWFSVKLDYLVIVI